MNNIEAINPRIKARQRVLNKIDPLFWILDRWVFEALFRPSKKNVPGEYEELDYADTDFLVENLLKHRFILWLNIILTIYMILSGLAAIFSRGNFEVVITGLLAPAMITGGAWYNLTFGGISEKFLGTAMTLTRCMFLAFSMSMTLLVTLLCYLTPWPVGLVLVVIYIGLYIASILYDNVDGLKIGLDTTMLRFSRASLNYYQKHGLLTREETHSEIFNIDTVASSEEIPLFTHYITMLEQNLNQLEKRHPVSVANHLIASSLDQLFHAVELPQGKKVDKGGEYDSYIMTAHSMSQVEVDEKTINYLELAIGALKAQLLRTTQAKQPDSNRIENELQTAEATLGEFKKIRARSAEKVPQALADHLFLQVFRQLLSLIKAHRHRFLASSALY